MKGFTKPRLIAFSSYATVTLMTLIVSLAARYLIIHSDLSLDFESLLNLGLSSYAFLGSIIASLMLLFYGTYLHTNWVQKQLTSPLIRTIGILFAGLLSYIVLRFIPDSPPAGTMSLALTSFAMLSEIFINPKQKNLTYIIIWVIILSAFSSMILFNAYIKYDVMKRMELAKSLFHKMDNNQVSSINSLKDELVDKEIFQKILSVPFPFKIHRGEFREISELTFSKFENDKRYLFNSYDRKGNAMLYETYTPLSYYEDFTKRSFKIDEYTFFDPIKNIYLKRWTKDVPHHQNSPFTIYLEQLPASNENNSVAYSNVIDDNLGKFNYVYYYKNQLKSFSNPQLVYPEDLDVNLVAGETYMRNLKGFSELFVAIDQNNMIKLSRKSARLIKPISLFSFVFLYIAILIAILGFLNSRLKILPNSFSLKFQHGNSLRNRLQLSIISLTILSFFIIGIVTIFYFYNLSSQYDQDILREKAIAMVIDVESKTNHLNKVDHMVNALSTSLSVLTAKHHMDINVYDSDGKLLLSSVPKSYEMKKKEAIMDPKILTAFQQNARQIKLEFESENKSDKYQQAYFSILDQHDNLSIIVQSLHPPALEANSKVSDFVGTLLNVYVFLFLIAGAIALAASNSITQPLVQLGNNIKRLKLGFKNEPLEWESNDELGQLVSNYNEMVGQLDNSARLLAKTERDLAWREMAKQVAHEIKNPLTPMKLSIQYLKRVIDQSPQDAEAMINRVSDTLIEQIDNLSGIANAFSSFGKMPQADNEKVVLNEVVEAVHDLFRKREDMDINMYEPIDDIMVFADKNHMIRILNNIVKNAIQSIPTHRRGRIDMKLTKNERLAIIEITDNGSGIADHMKDKVFSPNFTTKSSGTGLGLAICANMVESFNGSMYFDTVHGEGTTFYIKIPLMHLSDNFDPYERVMLDESP